MVLPNWFPSSKESGHGILWVSGNSEHMKPLVFRTLPTIFFIIEHCLLYSFSPFLGDQLIINIFFFDRMIMHVQPTHTCRKFAARTQTGQLRERYIWEKSNAIMHLLSSCCRCHLRHASLRFEFASPTPFSLRSACVL